MLFKHGLVEKHIFGTAEAQSCVVNLRGNLAQVRFKYCGLSTAYLQVIDVQTMCLLTRLAFYGIRKVGYRKSVRCPK